MDYFMRHGEPLWYLIWRPHVVALHVFPAQKYRGFQGIGFFSVFVFAGDNRVTNHLHKSKSSDKDLGFQAKGWLAVTNLSVLVRKKSFLELNFDGRCRFAQNFRYLLFTRFGRGYIHKSDNWITTIDFSANPINFSPQIGITCSHLVELPDPIFVLAWMRNKYVLPGKRPEMVPDELPAGNSRVIVDVEPYSDA